MIRASGADDDVAPCPRLLFRKLRFLVIVDRSGGGGQKGAAGRCMVSDGDRGGVVAVAAGVARGEQYTGTVPDVCGHGSKTAFDLGGALSGPGGTSCANASAGAGSEAMGSGS